jgi:hypothetical protein
LVILALAVPALAQAAPTPFTIDLLGLGQMRDATGGVRVIASMRAVTSDYHPCPGAIIVAQWRGAVTGYSRTVTTRFGNGGMLSPRVVKPTGAFTLTIISVTAPSGWVWDAANSDTTITRPVH